ncbi:hypothetical protein LT85_4365 [Collimonas arenae]|uniref:Uncharacterized protein n=1 Tax=Collimonas arenae TaxID=279058 RepID=A0A0A1FFJ8_9BURK|nr:hypothetical protein LT85_4365 [Collimonas arenae]
MHPFFAGQYAELRLYTHLARGVWLPRDAQKISTASSTYGHVVHGVKFQEKA